LACAYLASQICLWDRKFKSNFFRRGTQNGFEFVEQFAIALYICTVSSF